MPKFLLAKLDLSIPRTDLLEDYQQLLYLEVKRRLLLFGVEQSWLMVR
jgi:uncharacterized protein (DUF1499 family)